MKPYRVSISCLKFRALGFERKDKQGPMHKQTLRFRKHSRQNINFLLHLNTVKYEYEDCKTGRTFFGFERKFFIYFGQPIYKLTDEY